MHLTPEDGDKRPSAYFPWPKVVDGCGEYNPLLYTQHQKYSKANLLKILLIANATSGGGH